MSTKKSVKGCIRPDQLTKEMANLIGEYGDDVKKALAATIDELAEEALKTIKDHAPESETKHKGTYKKNLTIKMNKTGDGKVIWGGKSYPLTSLLEHGHQKVNGKGRTKAIPHFSFGQEYLEKNFDKVFKSKLKKEK